MPETGTSSMHESSPTSSLGPPGTRSGKNIESVRPCSLLTDTELARFGEFEEGNYRPYGTGRNCTWNGVRESASEKVPLVDLIIQDNAGIDVVPDLGGGLRSGRTNGTGREVVQTSNDGGCVVSVAVGEGSRVDVVVSYPDAGQACDMANQLAEIIDPKLPVG